MDNKDNEVYSTKDLLTAAAFVMLKFKIQGVDYQIEGYKRRPVGFFKFDNSKELREAEYKLAHRDLAFEPLGFMATYHHLKSWVENSYNNPHVDFNKMPK